MKNIKLTYPVILMSSAIIFTLFLTVYQVINKSVQTQSLASRQNIITVSGVVNKLTDCLYPSICFDLFDDSNGEHYYLFSSGKKVLKLRPKGVPDFNVDLSRYEGRKVEIKGYIVNGSMSYLVPTSISEREE